MDGPFPIVSADTASALAKSQIGKPLDEAVAFLRENGCIVYTSNGVRDLVWHPNEVELYEGPDGLIAHAFGPNDIDNWIWGILIIVDETPQTPPAWCVIWTNSFPQPIASMMGLRGYASNIQSSGRTAEIEKVCNDEWGPEEETATVAYIVSKLGKDVVWNDGVPKTHGRARTVFHSTVRFEPGLYFYPFEALPVWAIRAYKKLKSCGMLGNEFRDTKFIIEMIEDVIKLSPEWDESVRMVTKDLIHSELLGLREARRQMCDDLKSNIAAKTAETEIARWLYEKYLAGDEKILKQLSGYLNDRKIDDETHSTEILTEGLYALRAGRLDEAVRILKLNSSK